MSGRDVPPVDVSSGDARAVKVPGSGGSAPEVRKSRLRRLRGERSAIPEPLVDVVPALRQHHPKTDISPLVRAFETADRLHAGQARKSGEPYITHPVAVAQILAELGMGVPTLVAALLHDTVEDTDYGLDDVRAEFGDEVALLVDGVTKLDRVTYGESSQAETVRKMVLAMARDIRVLLVKLADRLHNMRTLQFLPAEKQQKKARETLEIYAPLAHRLGMNAIKWELEDLSFAALYPKVYEEIVRLVADQAPSRNEYLASVISTVEQDLKANKIKATVTGRPKHYYSIYQKMIVRGRDFNDIYDLVALRVLVESERDCYAAVGTVHARWKPIPGRFKDFIAMPKFNLYQSLHTTVIGPEGRAVEVQIRSHDMHRRAEYGVAAHWKYKEEAKGGNADSEMQWLRQIVDWQKETADPSEFLESLRFDIGSGEIFVFTPKGDVVALPTGSTPVDFAYSVHTEVGHRCIGARINGRLVPLDRKLSSGDTVEVFTSKAEGAGPSRDWLTFVASGRARSKIKSWFTKEAREEAVDQGKDLLARAIRKQGLPLHRILSGQALQAVLKDLHLADVNALYRAVGDGQVQSADVVKRLMGAHGGADGAVEDLAEAALPSRVTARRGRPSADPGVVVAGDPDVWVKLARCCTPVPPDPIIGFVTRGAGVSVHRADCINVASLQEQPDRIVDVEWAPTSESVYLVNIQVEALDRPRLLSDVTRVLSEGHVNILSASVRTDRDRMAISRFSFEMGDPGYLDHLLGQVRQVDGVFDAYRMTSARPD